MSEHLPHNPDAEQAVLGAVLLDSDAIFRVLDIIGADDFYEEKHRIIFKTIMEMVESDIAVDIVTVNSALREAGRLDSVGGVTYLSSLSDTLPDITNVRHYAKDIRGCCVRRGLIVYGDGF